MNAPALEILESDFDIPDISAVEPEIQEFLSANGEYGKFVNVNPLSVTNYRTMGWRPVLIDELPKPLQGIAVSTGDDPKMHYGQIRRADCLLMARTFAQKLRWEKIDRIRTQRVMGGGNPGLDEAMQEVNQRVGARFVHPDDRLSTNNPPESHVYGGPGVTEINDPELRNMLRKTLDAAETP
jgi:hypothetical protein